jgi:hypothetical protein
LRGAAPWADYEAAGRDKLRNAPGHSVYKISDAQLAEWKKAAEPLTAQWAEAAKKAGADTDGALRELKAALAKHNAAY